MKVKTLFVMGFIVLMMSTYIPIAIAHPPTGYPPSYDPTTLVIDSIGEPESLDPAWAYDTASADVVQSVYDGLLMYKIDMKKGPYEAGLVDQFEPKLATEWTVKSINEVSPEGLTWKQRLYFKIRTSVKFQDWNPATPSLHILTPEDAEYSFERLLVQDRDGGPQWMIYDFLLSTYAAASPSSDPNFGKKIDHAVENNSTHIWFNLVSSFPDKTVLQILSFTLGGIVEKSWAVSKGDFDGDWTPIGGNATARWEHVWNTWHNPAISKIEGDMMGAGPYKFQIWNKGVSWAVVKFDDYWDGWPARVNPGSTERIGGFITNIIWNYFPDWSTRRSRLLVGDSDFTDVDRQFRDQALGQPGIRCYYPYNVLAATGLFFTFDITTTSPYMGVSGGLPPGTFAQTGIPPNIFNDINVRKGFAYAFDYNSWLAAAYLGEGEQPADPVIKGLLYDNPFQPKYYYNLGIAATYLATAWGGALWSNGMKFTITYNTGNVARQTAAEMLASNINSLNSKFHVDTAQVDWGSTYLPAMVAGELPLFIIGWAADYPDPHDFVFPFQHSQGTFAAWQKYNNPTVDAKINQGIATPDGPGRQQIYYDLQSLYYDDVPSVMIVQSVGRHFEREWVRGWHYHPIAQNMYYHFWKTLTHYGDASGDGLVDVLDVGVLSAHWNGPPAGSLGYTIQADLTGGDGGTSGSVSGPVLGIPDGVVNVIDVSLVNAYYDGPPQGPDHPT